MAAAPRNWMLKRLTVMATQFSIGRTAQDEGALTVWLAECYSQLADLPHDIVAAAIDDAIKTRSHGFMPSVGEIRAIAVPLADTRRLQLDRLEQMFAAIDQGPGE